MDIQVNHSANGNDGPTQYRMVNPEAIEVTVCGNPAVPIAKFLHLQSTGSKVKMGATAEAQLTLGIPMKDSVKRQAFGYATAPWIHDYYGDMLNLQDVETAQNTFMKNMANGNVLGGGVGEEHYLFFENAHVVASCIDYTGSIGGIPGGWWFGVQFTDNTTWEKVLNGEYTGFSMTSYIRWKSVGSGNTLENIADNIPNLSKLSTKEISQIRQDGMKTLGIYTYPSEKTQYADNVNCRLPIDTVGRSLLVLDYLGSTMDGYSKEDYKTILTRTVNALESFKVSLPDKIYTKLGLEKPKSAQAVSTESVYVISKAGFEPRPKEDFTLIERNIEPIEPITPVEPIEPVMPIEPLTTQSTTVVQTSEGQSPDDNINTQTEGEIEMNAEEIRKAVADGIAEGVAQVLKTVTPVTEMTVEKTETPDVETVVKSVIDELKAAGVIADKSEPSIEEQYAKQYEIVNKGMQDMQELLVKLSQKAPAGLASRGVGAQIPTSYVPDYPVFELTDTTGRSFKTTKEDYEFVKKWASENGFVCDTTAENMRAAANSGLLPSQNQ